MQWRMVRRRGPQASWTLVGDLAQSSWPDVHEAAAAIRDLVGTAPSRSFELRINYRSPAEVFDLAGRVIAQAFPEASLPQAVRRTGIDPELLQVPRDRWIDEVGTLIDRLAGQVEGTIGVIIPPEPHRSTRPPAGTPARARARLSVLTPLQSKGLEYDAVVVVSPDDIVAESSGAERVLYVALTRPTQRLVTIDLDDGRSPLAALQQPGENLSGSHRTVLGEELQSRSPAGEQIGREFGRDLGADPRTASRSSATACNRSDTSGRHRGTRQFARTSSPA